jgi:hypothetical protein
MGYGLGPAANAAIDGGGDRRRLSDERDHVVLESRLVPGEAEDRERVHPTDARIDMEFKFEVFGPQQYPTAWQDLAEGSSLVSCVSTDGKMVFIQMDTQ